MLEIIFRADKKSNYAIEALLFLARSTILLPPRLRLQLLWSKNSQKRGCRSLKGNLGHQ